jgi:hypothetical protein
MAARGRAAGKKPLTREATMLTKQARLFLSLTAAAPLMLAGCTDNNVFNPQNEAAGTYRMTVFDSKSVPVTYVYQPGDANFPNGGTTVVRDGTLVLNSNGTFVETNNFEDTPTGQGTTTRQFVSSGTWSLNQNDFTLSDPSRGRQIFGTIIEDVNGVPTVNYTEDNGGGTFTGYEYKRD